MKEILNELFEYKSLTKERAKEILVNLAKGEYNPSQMAAFLTVFMMRSITVEELEGFRDAMLELCVALDLKQYDAIDLCGTGGDYYGQCHFGTAYMGTLAPNLKCICQAIISFQYRFKNEPTD